MNKGGLPDFRGRDEAISRVWQVCLFACTGLSFGMQLCAHVLTHCPGRCLGVPRVRRENLRHGAADAAARSSDRRLAVNVSGFTEADQTIPQ